LRLAWYTPGTLRSTSCANCTFSRATLLGRENAHGGEHVGAPRVPAAVGSPGADPGDRGEHARALDDHHERAVWRVAAGGRGAHVHFARRGAEAEPADLQRVTAEPRSGEREGALASVAAWASRPSRWTSVTRALGTPAPAASRTTPRTRPRGVGVAAGAGALGACAAAGAAERVLPKSTAIAVARRARAAALGGAERHRGTAGYGGGSERARPSGHCAEARR
jgi:hypothetical protein